MFCSLSSVQQGVGSQERTLVWVSNFNIRLLFKHLESQAECSGVIKRLRQLREQARPVFSLGCVLPKRITYRQLINTKSRNGRSVASELG